MDQAIDRRPRHKTSRGLSIVESQALVSEQDPFPPEEEQN